LSQAIGVAIARPVIVTIRLARREESPALLCSSSFIQCTLGIGLWDDLDRWPEKDARTRKLNQLIRMDVAWKYLFM
jgi:UDP-N-acetylmuramyl pentapeptide phosphotransferase/UDP-N-acetylglucosamine-1-phosphate transferase